jgi:hypothetical protein
LAKLDAANAFTSTGNNTFAGNVGIGTTSTAYKLGVAGDINTTGIYRVNGSQIASNDLSDGSTFLTKNGISGTFTSNDGKTITVVDGQITSIV